MADPLGLKAGHPLRVRAHLRSFGLALTLCAWPAALVAQAGDRPSVGTVQHPALAPGGRLGLRTVPTVVAARWASAARARLATQQVARQHDALMLALYPPPTEPVILGIPPLEPPPGLGPIRPGPPVMEGGELVDAIGRYADLNFELGASLSMRMDQFTNERCTVTDISALVPGCQGGFPTPVFDQTFNLRVGGIVGERLHINVDYDTERDFSANNNINVYYQGREDEILRRVDIGNVTFNPPPFRFVTATIPENSFGMQAQAQLGAFEFNAIVAQQRGSQLRTRVYSVGETTSEAVERELRDLDYERGRFFSVVDPRTLPGYPAIDLLSPAPETVPADRRPVQLRVYRLRSQALSGINPNLGGIDAVAVRDDSPQRVGPFPWELLLEGRDYYLDPSGLWFALQTRVSDSDFLAVSYVTASGDTVGTFPAVNRGQDTLFLLYEPRRGPDAPTFHHELRNTYRVGAQTDLDRRTLGLRIAVNESEQPLDGSGTYLQRLGLAQANNQNFLDEANRVFPREREPNGGLPIRALFVVFPHLVPFADTAKLQAGERNDSLYRTPTYLLGSQGPPARARLRFNYEARSGGDRSLLSLGAIQIREGTEKILIGERELRRGQDYEIDYDAGQVRFLNPDLLFQSGVTQVTAQFEENQAFDIAPTSLMGLTTRYDLGSRGSINVIGLMQRESSPLLRPTLGFEPQSTFVGGLSTQLLFRPDAVTRALNALPFISTTVPSTLTLNGEIAVSRPNPNSVGQAWLEEFENTAFRPVGLGERSFHPGGAPTSGRGLPVTHLDAFGGFSPLDAVPLVWQNIIQVGETSLQLTPNDIDSTILLVGSGRETETVLWLSLKPDTVGGAPDPVSGQPRWIRSHTTGPRWRSLNQPFDNQGLGIDLSRTEFIEFWVLEDADRLAQRNQAILVFDFGTVLEDAVAFGPNAFTVTGTDTVFTGFQFIGVGQLDSERDSLTGVFNAGLNDQGIHGDRLPFLFNTATGDILENHPTCSVEGFGLTSFPLGDLAANCTRGNGFLDAEDLNGDNRLDISVGAGNEDVFRYVFPVGDDRYFVRTGGSLEDRGRQLVWRLYRMPFREDTLQIGTPNIRQVRALRLTMVVPDQGGANEEMFVALARMRLVGAPWLKRAATPIAGLGGAVSLPHGEVIAAVVTTENRDLGYTSPPGVLDQANQRGAAFDIGVRQVNETSLRLLARDLRVGERAEAFLQFPDEAGKNFLRYRTLRAWARGRGPGWEDGDLQFFIKVGRDEDNFYLYRAAARTVSWEPEVVVSLERWLFLRAEIEGRWLRGEAPGGAGECGAGDPTAYVACDGGHLVQVRDPGVAPPNLARVSEMAVGMYRVGQSVFIEQAEVWVDDIRLSDVVDDMGVAGAVDVRLTAADVGDLSFGYQSRDANFQQIGQDPSFVTDASMRFGSTLRADKLLPAGLGMNIPISVQHLRTGQDPFYLDRSDLRGDALVGLRRPNAQSTALQASARRTVRGTTGLERLLFDPWNVTVGLSSATSVFQLAETRNTNRTGRLEYRITPGAATTAGAPGFLRGLVGALPGFISRSEFGRGISSSRLRVNPFQVRGAATITDNRTSRLSYRAPVRLASDAALTPLTSQIHALRTEAGADLRPYNGLGFRLDWSSTRDLRELGDTTTVGRLISRERRSLLGRDVGYEQLRTLNTGFTLTPTVSAWFRPRFTITSAFTMIRDPNGRQVVRVDGDSAGAFRLPETITATRQREAGATVDPARLIRNLTGTSRVGRLFAYLLPFDGTISQDVRGTFDRPPFRAPLSFQFALGGTENFRFQDGVPATSASETETHVLTGGTRLPLGLVVRGTYRSQVGQVWSRRFGTAEQSEVEQRSRDWPSATVNWVYTPRWALRRLIANLSAGLLYRETEALTIQPSATGIGGDARTETRTSQLTPNLSLTLPHGIVATGRYNHVVTDAITSGNVTTTETNDWNATMNFRFRPPPSVVRLENEIQTTVNYGAAETVICLLRADTSECTEVSQHRRRSLDLRMETGFSLTVRGGLSLNYTRDEARHLSSRTRRVSLTVFADIFFDTGQLQ